MEMSLGHVCVSRSTCAALEYHANTSPKTKRMRGNTIKPRCFSPKFINS